MQLFVKGIPPSFVTSENEDITLSYKAGALTVIAAEPAFQLAKDLLVLYCPQESKQGWKVVKLLLMARRNDSDERQT